MSNANGSRLRHGHKRVGKQSREYCIWAHMVNRCTSPANKYFHRYGGRGIGVCDRWLVFDNFLEDMGLSNGLTLDRVDNNKGYSLENCRWVDWKTQQRNRSSNRIIDVDGFVASLAEHCEKAGVKYSTVHARLKSGMTAQKALMNIDFRGFRKDALNVTIERLIN